MAGPEPDRAAQTATTARGALSGALRDDCGELYAALGAPPAVLGFAIAGAGASARVAPLTPVAATAADVEVIAGIIERATGLKVAPTVEYVYRVDLDGDGKPERVLQAAHPSSAARPDARAPSELTLTDLLTRRPVLQELCPIAQSIPWLRSQCHWASAGVEVFRRGAVCR